MYIGESNNIYSRWIKYKRLECKDQSGIYNSLSKHGVDSHTFEIIEECEFEDLKCRERYWQDYYNSVAKGLNCILTQCGELKREVSIEIKQRIAATLKNNKITGKYKSTSKFTESARINALKWHMSDENTIKKTVLNLETGIFYNSLKEACNTTNYNYNYFKHMLNPKSTSPNKTSFIVLI